MAFIPYTVQTEEIVLPTGSKGWEFEDFYAAMDYADSSENLVVIHGDGGKYWVCDIHDALQLEALGYQWPPLP